MTTNSRKVLIETESTETLTLRIAGKSATHLYCEKCGRETQMLDLDSAVTASGRGARELIREIEDGVLHSSQTSAGHLLICDGSL